MNNKKCAFATIVTKAKYEVMAGRMWQSLQYFESKYPFEILVADDLLDKEIPFLINNNIPFRRFKKLSFEYDYGFPKNRFKDTLSKFILLTLVEYDYICFIDADCMITNNIDYLFDGINFKTPFRFMYPAEDDQDSPNGKRICGEIFWLRPNEDYFKNFQKIAQKCSETIEADEPFIKEYYKYCIIDSRCTIGTVYPTVFNDILHFSGIYKISQLSEYNADLARLYYDVPIQVYINNWETLYSLQRSVDDIISENIFPKIFDIHLNLTNKED